MHQHTEQAEQTPRQNTAQFKVTVIDGLRVMAKRNRMICMVTLVAAILSLAGSFILPNIYTAKTMILPTQEDKNMMSSMFSGTVAGLAGLAGASLETSSTTEEYVSLLKSEVIKDPIIDQYKLLELYGKKFRADVYKKLDKRVFIAVGKKDGIITITVDDKDPKRAAEMANSYVDELGKLVIRLNETGAGQNRTFLEERLGTAKSDLAKAGENLKSFETRNKAVQITAQTEASIKGIAALKAELADDEVKLATLRSRFTDSSQEVKSINASVANLKSQIAKFEGSDGNRAIPSLGSIPALGQEYIRLMREFKIKESLVELLTKQYERERFSEEKDVVPFQVLMKARVPEKKRLPLRSLIVVISTLTAFFGSILAAFVLDAMDALPDEDKNRLKELKSEILSFRKKTVASD